MAGVSARVAAGMVLDEQYGTMDAGREGVLVFGLRVLCV
jgi:hypothetical protein